MLIKTTFKPNYKLPTCFLQLSFSTNNHQLHQTITSILSNPSQNLQSRVSKVHHIIALLNKQQIPVEYRHQINSYISETVREIKTMPKIHQDQMMKLVGAFCLSSFENALEHDESGEIKKLITDKEILSELIKNFNEIGIEQKGYVIKFISKFHENNTEIHREIQGLLLNMDINEKESTKAILYFLRELVRYLPQIPEATRVELFKSVPLSNCIKKVENEIRTLPPKYLYIFSKILESLQQFKELKFDFNAGMIIHGIELHIRGLEIVKCNKIEEFVNLIRTLENVNQIRKNGSGIKESEQNKVKAITLNIYEYIKRIAKHTNNTEESTLQSTEENIEEKEESIEEISENEKENLVDEGFNMRLIDVNILMESMLTLSVIDPQLFSLLETQFFKLILSSSIKSIKSHIYTRLNITKAIISNLRQDKTDPKSQEKIRLIKQEHTRFIVELLENLRKHEGINLVDLLKTVQICQEIPVKSKKVKRILNSLVEKQEEREGEKIESLKRVERREEEIAFLSIVVDGF